MSSLETRRSTCKMPASPILLWPHRQEHALRPDAGDASAPQRRLGHERSGSENALCGNSRRSGSTTSSRGFVFERMVTPADWDQQHRDPSRSDFQPGAQPVADAVTFDPGTVSRILSPFTWSAAAPIPGSGLPVIFESARITARLIGEDLGVDVPVDGDDSEPRLIEGDVVQTPLAVGS